MIYQCTSLFSPLWSRVRSVLKSSRVFESAPSLLRFFERQSIEKLFFVLLREKNVLLPQLEIIFVVLWNLSSEIMEQAALTLFLRLLLPLPVTVRGFPNSRSNSARLFENKFLAPVHPSTSPLLRGFGYGDSGCYRSSQNNVLSSDFTVLSLGRGKEVAFRRCR